MAITREKRLELYNAITALGSVWGKSAREERVEFLNRIWELRLMSSSDPRFTNAAEDVKKHLVDNDDWDDNYVFLDRFKLLECSEKEFLKFLNVVISPDFRQDKNEIEKYVSTITSLLPKKYEVKEITDKNGKNVYLISEKEHEDGDEDQYPIGLRRNEIPFFVEDAPAKYPAFQIITDNWDDFGYKTTFHLYYLDKEESFHVIGDLKILQEGVFKTALSGPFLSLPSIYCSVGQSIAYYKKLKNLLPDQYETVLYALKDAAWFSEIHYRFENSQGFLKSLLRNTEVFISRIKRKVEREKDDIWDFSFKAKVPYSEQAFDINFEFGNLELDDNPNRIKALIGVNGAGKTSILKSLVESLIRNGGVFEPSRPVFSKVIAISFSIFDTFITLRGKSVLTYTYCGLHDKENTVMSVEDREARLRASLIWINGGEKGKSGRNEFLINKFCRSLTIVFPEDWVDSVMTGDGLDIDAIIEKSRITSTGESMILNLIASLYANIRLNSLIVFDEMEVHLHPKAIRQMMSLLFKITREFDSACILATHSSIVVQELLADNVIIIEKDEDGKPQTRILNHESLAENLSVISDEIFEEASISPHYKSFVRTMAEESESFEALLEKLSSKNLPPSLPLYMLARYEFENANKK